MSNQSLREEEGPSQWEPVKEVYVTNLNWMNPQWYGLKLEGRTQDGPCLYWMFTVGLIHTDDSIRNDSIVFPVIKLNPGLLHWPILSSLVYLVTYFQILTNVIYFELRIYISSQSSPYFQSPLLCFHLTEIPRSCLENQIDSYLLCGLLFLLIL